MDKLNDDILDIIIEHLHAAATPPKAITLDWNPFRPQTQPPPPATANWKYSYAAVNKRWQALVERRAFAHIALRSPDLPAFAAIFASNPHRRASLRRLAFTVSLPTHGASEAHFSQNLGAFRCAVIALFDLLKQWDDTDHETDGQGGGRLELQLDAAWAISDAEGPMDLDLDFDVTRSSASRRYLTLRGPDDAQDEALPPVRRITSFVAPTSAGRAIHPTTLCALALAMPRLGRLSLEHLDAAPARLALRREHRAALAAGLSRLLLSPPPPAGPGALAELSITREVVALIHNHGYDAGTLEDGGAGDALSLAIRRAAAAPTTALTHLRLENPLVSAQLFPGAAGGGGAGDGDGECWPTLRRLTITGADILAPSGAWYYTGDEGAVEAGTDSAPGSSSPGSGDESSGDDEFRNGGRPTHEWRVRPDPDTFNPLVATMTDAVCHRMPAVESAHLDVGMGMSGCVGVAVRFVEAGVKVGDRPDWEEDSEEEARLRRCYCWVGRGTEWEVPKEVLSMWEEWVGENGRVELGRWPPTS